MYTVTLQKVQTVVSSSSQTLRFIKQLITDYIFNNRKFGINFVCTGNRSDSSLAPFQQEKKRILTWRDATDRE